MEDVIFFSMMEEDFLLELKQVSHFYTILDILTFLEGYNPLNIQISSNVVKQISKTKRDIIQSRLAEIQQLFNRIFTRFINCKNLIEVENKIAWQINIDVMVIGDIYFNEIDLLSFGIKKALETCYLPKLDINFNSLSNEYSFELLEEKNYPFEKVNIPHLFIMGIAGKGHIFYDLSMKEFLGCESLFLGICENQGKIQLIEKWGIFKNIIIRRKRCINYRIR